MGFLARLNLLQWLRGVSEDTETVDARRHNGTPSDDTKKLSTSNAAARREAREAAIRLHEVVDASLRHAAGRDDDRTPPPDN